MFRRTPVIDVLKDLGTLRPIDLRARATEMFAQIATELKNNPVDKINSIEERARIRIESILGQSPAYFEHNRGRLNLILGTLLTEATRKEKV